MTGEPAQTPGTVLLVQYSSDRNGSSISGLSLANGLRQRGWRTHVAFGYPGPMEAVYQAAGHNTCVVEHKNWLRRAHPLRFAKDVVTEWCKASAFQTLIRKIGPDVVYINTAVSLAAAVAARRCATPTVWHLRELFADVGGEMQAPMAVKPLVRRLFRRLSDTVVVNSRAVARNLLGSDAQMATVIPNAVEAACFDDQTTQVEARLALGLPSSGEIVGVPGTLRPVKGHLFFLRAIADLCERNTGVLFAVTGDGEPAFVDELKSQVRQLGLEQRVIFTGVLNGMTSFYRACDIVCVPSRGETFGRVVIEAFAAGAPVVATEVGGIPEIVEDSRTGLLVPYGDVPSLTAAIERMLSDKELREQLARNARDKAEHSYRDAVYHKRVARLIEDVLASRLN